jgi:hypothetical protein
MLSWNRPLEKEQAEEGKLGLLDVDVGFRMRQQFLERRAGEEITNGFTEAAGRDVKWRGVRFGGEVAFQCLVHGPADAKGSGFCRMGRPSSLGT